MGKSMKYCPKCNELLRERERYCPRCGVYIRERDISRMRRISLGFNVVSVGAFLVFLGMYHQKISDLFSIVLQRLEFLHGAASYFDVQMRLIFMAVVLVLVASSMLLVIARKI